MEELCRLCATKSNDLVHFKEAPIKIHGFLSNCNISLKKSKFLHELICGNCQFLLENFSIYLDTVRSAQKIFEAQIGGNSAAIKSCFVGLERLAGVEVKSESSFQDSDLENFSDIEDIDSDGSNFIITKQKKGKRRRSFPAIQLDQKRAKTIASDNSVPDPEPVPEKVEIKLETEELCSDQEQDQDQALGSDFEPSEDEYKPDNSSDSESNTKPRPKIQKPKIPKKKPRSSTLFPENWEDPFQKYFSNIINREPGLKPIDFDIPDDWKLPDGSVTDEAQQHFQELGTWGTTVELRCNKCDLLVDSYLEMRKHFRLEHSNSVKNFLVLNCKLCGTETPQRCRDNTMICHAVKEHHLHLKYSCLECDKLFWNFTALYQHYKSGHAEMLGLVNFCLVCGIPMDYQRMLVHSRRHEVPGSGFEKIFKEHLNRDSSLHENPLGIPDSEKLKDGGIKDSYVDQIGLQKWSSVMMDCCLCDKQNVSIYELKKHYDKDHNQAERKTKIFRCKVGMCIFSRRTELIATNLVHHFKEHDTNKSLCCFVCSKYFWNYVDLHMHLRQVFYLNFDSLKRKILTVLKWEILTV
jgi:hypothetical protein